MKGKSIGLIVVLAIVVIVGFMGCNGYNGVVKADETVKQSWNDVNAQYQNRSDLVKSLVGTVKGAANFEQETLTKVIEARAKASSVNITGDQLTPENMARFQQAQSELSGALSRLLLTVERYPDLKASQNFLELQRQLEKIENGVYIARRKFNEAVNDYNVKVRSFPMSMLAGMFGFKTKEGYKSDDGAEKAPPVDFTK
jgi:LemA protein